MSLFNVGEDVILQSSYAPKFNGEYIVQSVEPYEVRIYADTDIMTAIQCYKLSGLGDLICAETSLRKKHKPSTKSLKEIISESNKELIK